MKKMNYITCDYPKKVKIIAILDGVNKNNIN